MKKNIKFILDELKKHHFEAFIVGGAVRDTLLNREINDYDITTNALPEDIEKIFNKTIMINKRYGTVLVLCGDEKIEVTTYRTERDYIDGRRPETIEFTSDIKTDLSRRDFTINSLIMNEKEEIFDYFNARKSIEDKVIYPIGSATERFTEDYLRVYRYVRFTSQLNFHRNKELDQIILDMPINQKIAFDRIREEINKILLSDIPSKAIIHFKELNLLSYIFPGIEKMYDFNQNNPHHHLTVFEHSLSALDHSNKTIVDRLAGLFHDIGKPDTYEEIDGIGHFYSHQKKSVEITKNILQRLHYSNDIIDKVCLLIDRHMVMIDYTNDKSVKKFINKVGVENIPNFFSLRKADVLSCKDNDLTETLEFEKKAYEIISKKEPMSLKDLDITGYDLMKINIFHQEIGRIKKELLNIVLEDKEKNKKEILLKLAEELHKNIM